MNPEMYVGNGDVLINGTPSAIAIYLVSPLSPTRVETVLKDNSTYLSKITVINSTIDEYETKGVVSMANVKTTQARHPNIIPDHINIRAFTTKASTNMHDVFMSLLHKQAQKYISDTTTVVDVRSLHYSIYNDVSMFMVLRYYLDSVGTWLVNATVTDEIMAVSDTIVNAINTVSPDSNATTQNATLRMLDPHFTNIINNKGKMISETLRNVFEVDLSDQYSINRALSNVVGVKSQAVALVRIYKHWYNLAGKISSIE